MLVRRRRAVGIVLAVLTVAVLGHDLLARSARQAPPQHAAAVAAPTSSPKVAGVGAGAVERFAAAGPAVFRTAPGSSARVGTGPLTRYTVEVEDGLPYAPEDVATFVDATLADPRSWAGSGPYALQRMPEGEDVRVLLATPATTDRLCAPLRTSGQASCRNGRLVVLNERRWATGTADYAGRLDDYRRYIVNHEIGHALGQRHASCPGPGRPAPVMMQQTYGLRGCTPNPWP